MNNNYIENIINKYSKLDTFKSSYLDEIIRESSLDCRCGFKLTQIISSINPYRYALFILGNEPKVKTRAKRKIVLKKYRIKFRNIMLSVRLLAPLRNKPMYICNNCGNKMGYYQAIASNIIKIEPMPVPDNSNIFYHDKS